jgi:tripartite-type tricarboxylate transporter receptor subunit TctC
MRPVFRSVSVAATAIVLAASPALAAEPGAYPAKPVRWLLPVLPGGGGDLIARAVAPRLSDHWGQPVVIDNRPGGGGTLGMGLAAKMAPDGYTLVLGVSSFVTVAPAVYPRLSYDPLRDFTPVTLMLEAPLVIVTHPSLPVANVSQLIALARRRPDALSYATPGNGSAAHLATELFKSLSNTRILHVPYRGAPPAYLDLLGGQVTLYFGTIPSAMTHLKSGRLRALATTGARRSPALPGLPTVVESGLKDFVVNTWYGVLVPAGVAPAIIGRLHADITRVIRQPDLQERFASEGGEIVGNTPDQFGAFIARELETWRKVAGEARATID